MALFGNRIARPIGPDDMMFYEAGLTLRFAIVMSGKTQEQWDKMGHVAKKRSLDEARDCLCAVLNEKEVVERLPLLAKNLTARIA